MSLLHSSLIPIPILRPCFRKDAAVMMNVSSSRTTKAKAGAQNIFLMMRLSFDLCLNVIYKVLQCGIYRVIPNCMQ
jgi:hypothetical protein